jgi:hypothetical protein
MLTMVTPLRKVAGLIGGQEQPRPIFACHLSLLALFSSLCAEVPSRVFSEVCQQRGEAPSASLIFATTSPGSATSTIKRS